MATTERNGNPLLVLSFLNFIISNGLSTWGVKYISAGLALSWELFSLYGWWSSVCFLLRAKIPGKAIIGLLLGFGGVCIIFYEHLDDFFNPDFRLGILLS